MRIDFRLRPLREIAPWHNAAGSNPHLTWFGLTDGWYWISVDGAELFRYSQTVLDTRAHEKRGEPWLIRMGGLPYVDYQVAQLWGDLLDGLPDVLAPIPPRLARALGPDSAWAAWRRQAELAVAEAIPEREARNLLYDATRWQGKRRLDSAYLVSSPDIWCWSDGTDARLEWDNREQTLDGLPAWEAAWGSYAFSVAAYREAVRDFNARFMRRMADRVAIAQAEWGQRDAALDPRLAEQQLVHTRWAQARLAASAPQEPDHWDRVFAAISRIEALPRFTSGTAPRLP